MVILVWTLAQFQLPQILQHLERHGKTGLLTVVRGQQRVSIYVQHGLLMCVESRQGRMPLERRLFQAGVLSQHNLQEVDFELNRSPLRNPGRGYYSEARAALVLVELGLASHEQLSAWVRREAIAILQDPLGWSVGEVSFAEGVQPPADRLPLALPSISLVPSRSSSASPANLPAGNPESVIKEPTWPVAGSVPLFKAPRPAVKKVAVPTALPPIPATPPPSLFKRPFPFLPETPFPHVSLMPTPFVEEHIRPALHLPQVFKSSPSARL